VDTVKHMDLGAARLLGSSMKEFAARIGKDNFYLIAEITGGRNFAFDTLGITGLDAALGIDDIPDKLEFLAKGYRDPSDYFGLFRNSELVGQGSHTWFRNKVVTLFNDHDQVSKGSNKARFCADKDKANGVGFGLPMMMGGELHSIVPWSRLLDDQEALLAINTDLSSARTAWVTIDASLHKPGERLRCVYSTDGAQIGAEVSIEARNGVAVSLTVPSAGFVIFR